jgi:uncharacterized membrane protein
VSKQSDKRVEKLIASLRDIAERLDQQGDEMRDLSDQLSRAQEGYEALLETWANTADQMLREALPEGHPYTKAIPVENPDG